MTVLLVLFTFTTFLLIDHFRSRNTVAERTLHVGAAKSDAVVPRLQPALVAGFAVPENLRYHPGHTWALSESTNLVRVGMDDFASKLTGTVENIALPQRGQWIRQGQKLCTIYHDDLAVDMVSPVEGTVSDINEAVAKNPKLALSDSYGEGWLVTVNAPDAKTSFKNLLGGPLARWWMEESASRLQRKSPMAMAFAGALAQDGGEAINNPTSQIPDAEWLPIAREFFLS
jgi:glycine cleavage system H lipoate-binding protein